MYHALVLDLNRLRIRGLLAALKLSPKRLRRLSGGETVREGRTLDAQAQMFCFLARRLSPHVADLSPRQIRRVYEGSVDLGGRPREMRTRDFDLGSGLRARLYSPHDALSALIVFFHGGGFVAGSISSHDRPVRILADETRMPVLSVAYRLAPEHPFPAAVDDAFRAYRWARDNAAMLGANAARIAVAGDSAGGNLSAVVSRLAQGEGIMPALQVLIYPATDLAHTLASHRTFGKGFFLDARSIDYYMSNYAADDRDERASPLFAKRFDGLPPAIVHTAGFDPLVDEGDAYAKKLADAGVRVVHTRHDSLIHGFINFTAAIDAARGALSSIAADVLTALAD